jgi:hypothetical protein
MTSHIPQYTGLDLELVLARDFPNSVDEAKDILSKYGNQPWQQDHLRVRMACLVLADGDLNRLLEAVGAACRDPRNVMAWAESPDYFDAKTPEEQAAALKSDAERLKAWLTRR